MATTEDKPTTEHTMNNSPAAIQTAPLTTTRAQSLALLADTIRMAWEEAPKSCASDTYLAEQCAALTMLAHYVTAPLAECADKTKVFDALLSIRASLEAIDAAETAFLCAGAPA